MGNRAGTSEMTCWNDADETEALQHYRTLLNALDDGIYRLDTEGRLVAVNDDIVEMTGYARAKTCSASTCPCSSAGTV